MTRCTVVWNVARLRCLRLLVVDVCVCVPVVNLVVKVCERLLVRRVCARAAQGLPTSLEGFKAHPLYILKRHVGKYEVRHRRGTRGLAALLTFVRTRGNPSADLHTHSSGPHGPCQA